MDKNYEKYAPWLASIITKEDLISESEIPRRYNNIPNYVIVLDKLYREKRIIREDYYNILSHDHDLVEWFFDIVPYAFNISVEVEVNGRFIAKTICSMFYDKLSSIDEIKNKTRFNRNAIGILLQESIRRNDKETFDKFFTNKHTSILRFAVKNSSNMYFLQKILENCENLSQSIRYMENIREHKILASYITKWKSITLEEYYERYNTQYLIQQNAFIFIQALYELGISMDFLREQGKLATSKNLRLWLHTDDI